MPIYSRPPFDLLPEPAAPTPADYTEFQALAADLLPADDTALDQAGLDLAALWGASTDAEGAMDALGLDLAAGAAELAEMQVEAASDTLITETAAAIAQDAAVVNAGQGVDESFPET